jgi:hypothetical protein
MMRSTDRAQRGRGVVRAGVKLAREVSFLTADGPGTVEPKSDLGSIDTNSQSAVNRRSAAPQVAAGGN